MTTANAVQEDVSQNREEPGAAVRPGFEPIEEGPRPQAGVLHEVLRFGAIAGEPEREPIQRIQVDECQRLELAAPGAR